MAALAAGVDGLDDLRQLIRDARTHLKPGGTLLLEHGYDQANGVASLLRMNGFDDPRSWPDLAGILRVSGGKMSE
jgi:release factor glutamine methyltransferase